MAVGFGSAMVYKGLGWLDFVLMLHRLISRVFILTVGLGQHLGLEALLSL